MRLSQCSTSMTHDMVRTPLQPRPPSRSCMAMEPGVVRLKNRISALQGNGRCRGVRELTNAELPNVLCTNGQKPKAENYSHSYKHLWSRDLKEIFESIAVLIHQFRCIFATTRWKFGICPHELNKGHNAPRRWPWTRQSNPALPEFLSE